MKKLILIACVFVLMGAGCTDMRKCAKGHTEIVHHEESTWLQPMTVGKVTTFITHTRDAYDSEEFVCDEYATLSNTNNP